MTPVQREHGEQVHDADEKVDRGQQVQELGDILPGRLGADLDRAHDGQDRASP